jgi:hypothetical protein
LRQQQQQVQQNLTIENSKTSKDEPAIPSTTVTTIPSTENTGIKPQYKGQQVRTPTGASAQHVAAKRRGHGSHTPDWQPRKEAAAPVLRSVALIDRSGIQRRHLKHLSPCRQVRQPKEAPQSCSNISYTSRQSRRSSQPSKKYFRSETEKSEERLHQHKEHVTEVATAIEERRVNEMLEGRVLFIARERG